MHTLKLIITENESLVSLININSIREKKLKILVTGSNGFFGGAISKCLKRAGHKVIGASRRSGSGIEFLDVSSVASCEALLDKHPGIDIIVHCAAIAHANKNDFTEAEYRRVNGEGAGHLIDSAVAHGIHRFIHISSVSVYGEYDIPGHVDETACLNPSGYYGVSKKLAEKLCLQRADKIELFIFRMATMYSSEWLFNIRRKVTPPIFGRFFRLILDGKVHRYSLCSDINGANAVLQAVEGSLPQGIYNVADYRDYSLSDVLGAVEAVEGKLPVMQISRSAAIALLKPLIYIAFGEGKLNAYSRYWNFLENNLYSTEKLRATGFDAPARLLEIAID